MPDTTLILFSPVKSRPESLQNWSKDCLRPTKTASRRSSRNQKDFFLARHRRNDVETPIENALHIVTREEAANGAENFGSVAKSKNGDSLKRTGESWLKQN